MNDLDTPIEPPQLHYLPNTVETSLLQDLLSNSVAIIYRDRITAIYARFFQAFDTVERAYNHLTRDILHDDTKKIIFGNLRILFYVGT